LKRTVRALDSPGLGGVVFIRPISRSDKKKC
jgi:hypothetical protein